MDLNPIIIDSFKAYDIRGELGVNLNEAIAYRIGCAFAQILFQRYGAAVEAHDNDMVNLKPVIVIGSDIRHSSEQLKQSDHRWYSRCGCQCD